MTVLKRFDDALAPTKVKVLEVNEKLNLTHSESEIRDGALCRASGYPFYNTSKFDFARLLADPENIEVNFDGYFAKNVLPYNPIAYIDRSKDKIGYEIPFTRLLYKFTPPRSSGEVFAEFKALSEEETDLMKEIFLGGIMREKKRRKFR